MDNSISTLFLSFLSNPNSHFSNALLAPIFNDGKMMDDIDQSINDYLLFLQNTMETILFLDAETGEILYELPLTPQNLNSTIQSIFPNYENTDPYLE